MGLESSDCSACFLTLRRGGRVLVLLRFRRVLILLRRNGKSSSSDVSGSLMIFLPAIAAHFRVLDFCFRPDHFGWFWNLPTVARDFLILLRCGRVLVLHRRNVNSSSSDIADSLLLVPPDVADRFRKGTFRSAPTFVYIPAG